MIERKIVFWGAGFLCKNWLETGFEKYVEFILDNDESKWNKEICGKKIINPNSIDDWGNYYIIILSNYHDEIGLQLKNYGLIYGVDYISYIDYYSKPIEDKDVLTAIKEFVFEVNPNALDFTFIVRSKQEYEIIKKEYPESLKYERAINLLYQKKIGKRSAYPGRCSVCEEDVKFTVDYLWSDGTVPAWRETLFCPKCYCNSRMRFLIDYLSKYVTRDSDIYIYEYVTKTYEILKSRYPKIIGSEFLGEGYESGEIIDGTLHEDALNLSFNDATFDFIISSDVFEHVADYIKAFKEAFRCLKKNGKLIFTVPIFKDEEKTKKRISVENGKMIYWQPKVYHGNPLSDDGALVFTDFGWDVILKLREVGFSDAYAVVYYSADLGYFGDYPVIFEAIK